jgi:hypothetical protein
VSTRKNKLRSGLSLTGFSFAPTGFRFMTDLEDDPRFEFHKLCEALRNDEARNKMICDNVFGAKARGGPTFGRRANQKLLARLEWNVSRLLSLDAR